MISVVNRFAELINARGVQVTAHRLAVFRAVASKPHCTAEEVITMVRADIGSISHQGAYDALAVLVAAGLVRRIEPAGSPARFETRVGDNHHHLICRECGKTEDVECAKRRAPCLSPSSAQGYLIDEAEVIYWGRCPACQAKQLDPP